MPYGEQTLWPDHCVQSSHGATFHARLKTDKARMVVRKGMKPAIDSYSAFYENDRVTSTGLSGYLRNRGVTRTGLVGLATDFCVFYTAMDARREGFDVILVEDGCRAIDLDGSLAVAMKAMTDVGVMVALASDLMS
tara:strand:- start:9413 stop:9820 length:408 start_codon:yes stop_codon:yes gene_type:complete